MAAGHLQESQTVQRQNETTSAFQNIKLIFFGLMVEWLPEIMPPPQMHKWDLSQSQLPQYSFSQNNRGKGARSQHWENPKTERHCNNARAKRVRISQHSVSHAWHTFVCSLTRLMSCKIQNGHRVCHFALCDAPLSHSQFGILVSEWTRNARENPPPLSFSLSLSYSVASDWPPSIHYTPLWEP